MFLTLTHRCLATSLFLTQDALHALNWIFNTYIKMSLFLQAVVKQRTGPPGSELIWCHQAFFCFVCFWGNADPTEENFWNLTLKRLSYFSMFCFKMAAKKRIFVLRKCHVTKIWKKNHTFQNEVFNKIWLKIEEHEYIYNFELKFEKKSILFKNGGQTSFVTMCNNANLC